MTTIVTEGTGIGVHMIFESIDRRTETTCFLKLRLKPEIKKNRHEFLDTFCIFYELVWQTHCHDVFHCCVVKPYLAIHREYI